MPDQFDCVDFEALAVLYAAGELGDAERSAVEAHARDCAACTAMLANELKMRDVLAAGEAAEEIDRSGLLLARCRSELAERLDDEEKTTSKPWWRELLSPARWNPAFRHALVVHPGWSAAALLIIGAVGGLAGRTWYRETSLPLPGKPLMTVSAAAPISDRDLETMSVAGVRLEPQNGDAVPRIELRVFSNRPRVVQGSLNDAEILRVLTYVIAHPQRFDPGVRLDSLDALKTHASDPQVRAALCLAARQDDNPAVRLKAIEALQDSESDPGVMQAILDALSGDDNSGVRIEAVNSLLAALGEANASAVPLDSDVQEILRDRMANDPNQYIRQRSATALERVVSMETGATPDSRSPDGSRR